MGKGDSQAQGGAHAAARASRGPNDQSGYEPGFVSRDVARRERAEGGGRGCTPVEPNGVRQRGPRLARLSDRRRNAAARGDLERRVRQRFGHAQDLAAAARALSHGRAARRRAGGGGHEACCARHGVSAPARSLAERLDRGIAIRNPRRARRRSLLPDGCRVRDSPGAVEGNGQHDSWSGGLQDTVRAADPDRRCGSSFRRVRRRGRRRALESGYRQRRHAGRSSPFSASTGERRAASRRRHVRREEFRARAENPRSAQSGLADWQRRLWLADRHSRARRRPVRFDRVGRHADAQRHLHLPARRLDERCRLRRADPRPDCAASLWPAIERSGPRNAARDLRERQRQRPRFRGRYRGRACEDFERARVPSLSRADGGLRHLRRPRQRRRRHARVPARAVPLEQHSGRCAARRRDRRPAVRPQSAGNGSAQAVGGSARRDARDRLCGAMAAAPARKFQGSRRTQIPDVRRQPSPRHVARDGAVPALCAARERERARLDPGGLHLRQRAACGALSHRRRFRRRVSPSRAAGSESPRTARPGQRPVPKLGREPHVAGIPRQMDHDGLVQFAAAATAAERAGTRSQSGEQRQSA